MILNDTIGTTALIDPTPKALRNIVYDRYGRPLSRKHAEARDETNDEGFLVAGTNDASIRHLRMDRTGGIATANNASLFSDQFEGATINAAKWLTTSTTMAGVQNATTGFTFNSGNIVTASTGFMLRTLRTFARPMRSILQAKFRFRANHVVNAVMEVGFGDASTNQGIHSNGAYLQYTPAGAVQLVWTFNGGDITSAPVTGLDPSKYYTADIIMEDDQVSLILQDTGTGLFVAERPIPLPLASAKQFATTRLYGFARQYHSGAAPASAPNLILPFFEVLQLDSDPGKTFRQLQAGQGLQADFHPSTGVMNAQFTNSTAPGSAALSNIAAGYTTLGGLFQFAAVAGAVTDYALFGFTVPAPFQLHVEGIDIETWNTVAAVATTPTLLVWGAGIDQSAISLNTAGIVKKVLGSQSFPIGAAPGAKAERVSVNFDTPLVTNPGRIFTIILRMPVGTATATEIFQGLVSVRGYFE